MTVKVTKTSLKVIQNASIPENLRVTSQALEVVGKLEDNQSQVTRNALEIIIVDTKTALEVSRNSLEIIIPENVKRIQISRFTIEIGNKLQVNNSFGRISRNAIEVAMPWSTEVEDRGGLRISRNAIELAHSVLSLNPGIPNDGSNNTDNTDNGTPGGGTSPGQGKPKRRQIHVY